MYTTVRMLAGRPRRMAAAVVGVRPNVLFSTATTTTTPPPSSEQPTPSSFSSPKVKALFDRMSQLDVEQFRLVREQVLERLGRPRREKEFLWDGVGGGSKSNKSSDGDDDGTAAAATQEPTSFDVKLLAGFDKKSKIKIIKEVRSMLQLGLKEAKELVDNAPVTLIKAASKETAEEVKGKLVELGAEIELA